MLKAIKGENNSNTIIVGDFSSTLTSVNRPSGQKIKKDHEDLLENVIYIFSIEVN